MGGPTANSQQHHLVPSSAGDMSPLPSAAAWDAIGFCALHTEGLSPREGGQGGLGTVGENRASSTDSTLQGEQPHGQGEESTQSQGGMGEDKRGGLLAITVAVPSGWRSLPRPQLSARIQTGPGGAKWGEGMRVLTSPARGAVCAQGGRASPVWGGYLCLHHARPLVSDVLQRSSYVYLLYTWGRGGKRVLGGGIHRSSTWLRTLRQGRSSAALHLPLAIRFRTMSTRMYVPVLPAPSLQDRDAWTRWTGSRD